jgi:hypothetical protein
MEQLLTAVLVAPFVICMVGFAVAIALASSASIVSLNVVRAAYAR